jgi:hypothetical protein
MSSFFDEFGLLHLNPEKLSENGILYLTEYVKKKDVFIFDSERILRVHFSEGEWKQSPWDTRPASHDNMTALVVFADHHGERLGIDYWSYPHPRDLCFYMIMRGNPLGYLLLPFFSIALIISCLRTWKKRPDIFEKISVLFKEGHWPQTHTIHVHTDGKFLAWLRCSTGKFPITWFICEKILKKKFGDNWFHEIAKIYFHNPDHPLRKL